MTQYRTQAKDCKSNTIFLQGAWAHAPGRDIASVVFQNYDDDSKTTYDMGAIAMADLSDDAAVDGRGGLILRTSAGGGRLQDVFRLMHDGSCAAMGDMRVRSNAFVAGDLAVSGNLVATSATAVPYARVATLSNAVLATSNVVATGSVSAPAVNITVAADSTAAGTVRLFVDAATRQLKCVDDTTRVSATLAPSTAKGDLVGHDGATQRALPVGADGRVLTAASTAALGVQWSMPTLAEYNYAQSVGVSSQTTSTTAYSNKLTMTTAALAGGRYRVQVSFEVVSNTASRQCVVRCTCDGTEWMDGRFNCSTNNATGGEIYTNFAVLDLAAGVHTLAVDYMNVTLLTSIGIRDCRLELFRV